MSRSEQILIFFSSYILVLDLSSYKKNDVFENLCHCFKKKIHQQRIDDVRCKDKKGKLLGRKAKKKSEFLCQYRCINMTIQPITNIFSFELFVVGMYFTLYVGKQRFLCKLGLVTDLFKKLFVSSHKFLSLCQCKTDTVQCNRRVT